MTKRKRNSKFRDILNLFYHKRINDDLAMIGAYHNVGDYIKHWYFVTKDGDYDYYVEIPNWVDGYRFNKMWYDPTEDVVCMRGVKGERYYVCETDSSNVFYGIRAEEFNRVTEIQREEYSD